jgi:hypothetical protein
MCILDFSQRKDSCLTLSAMLCASKAMLLKTRLFRSFQITKSKAEAIQIILRNESEEHGNPARCPNWRKWSWATLGSDAREAQPLKNQEPHTVKCVTAKHCHHFEVLVVEPSCLLLEVDFEVASKQTMRPLTVLAHATHRQTIPFL